MKPVEKTDEVKTLYDEYGLLSDDACNKAYKEIASIAEKCYADQIKRGISMIEVKALSGEFVDAVTVGCAVTRLKYGVAKRQEREQ